MSDFRLPFAQARSAGLLPDLAPIRAHIGAAAASLYGELFERNPRLMPEDPLWSQDRHSELTKAQRALAGVCLIDEYVAPWEWLSHLLDVNRPALPWMVWSAREVGLGRTGTYIEHLIRLSGGEPDDLVATYRAHPKPRIIVTWERHPFEIDTMRAESITWWHSDAGRLDFNNRVFEFALSRLTDLIETQE
jgi:hypothetical protein